MDGKTPCGEGRSTAARPGGLPPRALSRLNPDERIPSAATQHSIGPKPNLQRTHHRKSSEPTEPMAVTSISAESVEYSGNILKIRRSQLTFCFFPSAGDIELRLGKSAKSDRVSTISVFGGVNDEHPIVAIRNRHPACRYLLGVMQDQQPAQKDSSRCSTDQGRSAPH